MPCGAGAEDGSGARAVFKLGIGTARLGLAGLGDPVRSAGGTAGVAGLWFAVETVPVGGGTVEPPEEALATVTTVIAPRARTMLRAPTRSTTGETPTREARRPKRESGRVIRLFPPTSPGGEHGLVHP